MSSGSTSLSLLINAYDDGLSTGRLRRDFRILGPSDIGKNLAALCNPKMPGGVAIRQLLRHRFPVEENPSQLWTHLIEVISDGPSTGAISELYQSLPAVNRDVFRRYLESFIRVSSDAYPGRIYDLRGMAVRNLIVAGAIFSHDYDYQDALRSMEQAIGTDGRIVLNSSANSHLAGLTSTGRILSSEASIVGDHLAENILDVFLLAEPITPQQLATLGTFPDVESRSRYLTDIAAEVSVSEEAKHTLMAADLIVLGPTTIDSSLLPTLKSSGCWRALVDSKAPKIMVANLVRERGTETVADQLRRIERSARRDLGNDFYLHHALDAIVANTDMQSSQLGGQPPRIAVDRQEIEAFGLTLIEAELEDPMAVGLHDGNHLMDNLTRLAIPGDLDGVSSEPAVRVQRKASDGLSAVLRDPLMHFEARDRIDCFAAEAGTTDRRVLRVIVAANGKGSRLGSQTSKALFPIAGKPSLLHIADKITEIDQDYLVVTNEQNDAEIRSALLEAGHGGNTLACPPRGSGAAVLAALEYMPSKVTEVLVVWVDAPAIQLATLQTCIRVFQAIGEMSALIGSSWESSPYAGVERGPDGQVVGLFQTKMNPDLMREFGEHDASFFVLDRLSAIEAIRAKQTELAQSSPDQELDLLQSIDLLIDDGKSVGALAVADAIEASGFNTPEEAARIEDRIDDDYSIEIAASVPATPGSEAGTDPASDAFMQLRFGEATQVPFAALAIDVDGNLLDKSGLISGPALERLHELATQGIPVALITARTLPSLESRLLQKLRDQFSSIDAPAMANIYAYPYNGAIALRIQDVDKWMYERAMPTYLRVAAMRALRTDVLQFGDRYVITPYKITIYPEHAEQQSKLSMAIRESLRRRMVPMNVFASGSQAYDGAIVLTSNEHGSAVHKGHALDHFALETGLAVGHIAKIGDRAALGGVDNPLLQGRGSFSTDEFDPNNSDHVSIPVLNGLRRVPACDWLLSELHFEVPAAPHLE